MTSIFCNEKLVKVLAQHNINPDSYGPAYDGESVGLDLYYTGPTTTIKPTNNEYSTMRMSRGALLNTGLHISLELGTVALLRERGSVTKTPLVLRAGVVDPGYTGEIFVNMINVSGEPFEIDEGQKLPVQLVVTTTLTDFKALSENEYSFATQTAKRAQGMIGSSDNATNNT